MVWIVDCANRTVAVYTSPSSVTILDEEAMIYGGDVLPGFTASVADLDLGSEIFDAQQDTPYGMVSSCRHRHPACGRVGRAGGRGGW